MKKVLNKETSAWKKCEEPELKAFLKYIATTETDSNLTDEIDDEVKSSKFNELWRNMFRTLEDMARDWGEVIGKEIAEEKAKVLAQDLAQDMAKGIAQDMTKQKLLDTARNAIAMNLSTAQISQLTGLSYDEIESLKTEQPA